VPRRRASGIAWTPNQIVAYNLAQARLYRGWTQDQAAEALAPYLGSRLSGASWSAMERSVEGSRVRQFTADDLFAFARGFGLPIGFFLTPPPPGLGERIAVAVPDASDNGIDPMELLDAVLGVDETLAVWKEYLSAWPAFAGRRARITPEGWEDLGPEVDDVHDRVNDLAELRAHVRLRERFGDLDAARDALERVLQVLHDLETPDEPGSPGTEEQPPARERKR
jgi:hypothetical protein